MLWSMKGHLMTRALGQRARSQRLRTEVLPVLAWPNAAPHLRKVVLRRAAGALNHMTRICLQLPPSECWVDRHTHMARGQGPADHLAVWLAAPPALALRIDMEALAVI